MNRDRAQAIVSSLANGVNPTNGEVLPADHFLNDADVARALFIASSMLRAKSPVDNAGKPWTPEMDHELLSLFDATFEPAMIALIMGRTVVGIEARLERHGRWKPPARGART